MRINFEILSVELLLFFLFLNSLFLMDVFGEELSSPVRFYEKNYSSNVFNVSPHARLKIKNHRKVKKSAKGLSQVSDVIDDLKSSKEASKEEQHTGGVPVLSVGVIVNASKQKHLQEVFKEFNSLLKENNLKAGVVYLIGKSKISISNLPIYKELSRKHIIVKKKKSVPSRYNISRSPTWILETNKGEILIEAVKSLTTYIHPNSNPSEPVLFSY